MIFPFLFFFHFFGFTGNKPDSHECILKNEDASEKHFIKIETATLASSFKSCSPQQLSAGEEDELHIINIPESAGVR